MKTRNIHSVNHAQVNRNQNGISLIFFALILVIVGTSVVFSFLNSSIIKNDKSKSTVSALAIAKEALIGYAIGNANISEQPVLPNPDLKLTSVIMEGSEAGMAGPVDFSLLGKFPWHSLGTPVLRDGWKECLWYAVSGRFKKSPGTAGVLNWDTQGQIDVIDQNGIVIATNLAALVISPGPPLQDQARTTVSSDIPECMGNYDARNYLDTYTAANAVVGALNYFPGSTNNRQALNTANKTFVLADNDNYNDHFRFITVDDIFNRLSKRSDFATQISALLNDTKFLDHLKAITKIEGSKGTLNVNCSETSTLSNRTFCNNWIEMLLLTDLASPPSTITIDGLPTATPCTRVIIFGGRRIGVQSRSGNDKNNPSNYLEDSNAAAFKIPTAINNSFSGSSSFNVANPGADIMRCL